MSKRSKKPIPRFATEDEERAFWDSADSTAYLDWHQSEQIALPNLNKPANDISRESPPRKPI